jgi:hypothetical protein
VQHPSPHFTSEETEAQKAYVVCLFVVTSPNCAAQVPSDVAVRSQSGSPNPGNQGCFQSGGTSAFLAPKALLPCRESRVVSGIRPSSLLIGQLLSSDWLFPFGLLTQPDIETGLPLPPSPSSRSSSGLVTATAAAAGRGAGGSVG